MREAILLIGPTGSGKTPLGECLARRGLWGRRCRHFDFGRRLRRVADAGDPTGRLGPGQVRTIREVLARGALLERQTFDIARVLLESFLAEDADGPAPTWIVLNGLPRHVEQAHALRAVVAVSVVVHLACSAETVLERIAANVGGDRADRCDDDLPAVRKRLAVFETRTAPLVDYYDAEGARMIRVDVGPRTTAEDLWRRLDAAGPRRR